MKDAINQWRQCFNNYGLIPNLYYMNNFLNSSQNDMCPYFTYFSIETIKA